MEKKTSKQNIWWKPLDIGQWIRNTGGSGLCRNDTQSDTQKDKNDTQSDTQKGKNDTQKDKNDTQTRLIDNVSKVFCNITTF